MTVSGPEARAFERELQRELPEGHRLFGLPVRCVARRRDRDDVLFELGDGTTTWAIVHLTWKSESDPDWPYVEVFESRRAALEAECL